MSAVLCNDNQVKANTELRHNVDVVVVGGGSGGGGGYRFFH